MKHLSQKFYDQMHQLESQYPHKTALLLPALHAAQKEYRWLSDSILDEIATYIEIHPAQVREVASFYTMYYLKPVGKYHIKICTNVACALRGAEGLMDLCEKKLNIRAGETTLDEKFTLSHEECLGACGTAPAIMLNDDYYEQMDCLKIETLIEKLGNDA